MNLLDTISITQKAVKLQNCYYINYVVFSSTTMFKLGNIKYAQK